MPTTQPEPGHATPRSGGQHGVRSECAGCGEVFCGVVPFDGHRRAATAAELIQDRWMSRRCRTTAEMTARGFSRCRLDRWSAPSRSAPWARTPGTPEEAQIRVIESEVGA